MTSDSNQNYYELLDVDPTASLEEIQEAYKEAKETYSTDSTALYSMFSEDEARQINYLLDEAYQTLSHHARRRDYDSKLRGEHFEVVVDKSHVPEETPIKKQPSPSFQNLPDEDDDQLGRTRFSSYQIDEVFEDEIRKQTAFDGSFLKKIREYKNVELDVISQHLKISKHHFQAIEENDFNRLPADVFIRSYIKQYSEALGIDAKIACDSYMKLLKEIREQK
tara:strand:+ start:22181 stop:22846 length:666 start_codon:yes stop_codon:yes gene_type:complete